MEQLIFSRCNKQYTINKGKTLSRGTIWRLPVNLILFVSDEALPGERDPKRSLTLLNGKQAFLKTCVKDHGDIIIALAEG